MVHTFRRALRGFEEVHLVSLKRLLGDTQMCMEEDKWVWVNDPSGTHSVKLVLKTVYSSDQNPPTMPAGME